MFTYELIKSGYWKLIATYCTSNAVDLVNFQKLTHTHSEYDTKFEQFLSSLRERNLYTLFYAEQLVGHKHVIIRWTFEEGYPGKDYCKWSYNEHRLIDLIKSIEEYFQEHTQSFNLDNISCVKYGKIESILD